MTDGLICEFCGEDGFQDRDELEEHIQGHPWVAKKPRFRDD